MYRTEYMRWKYRNNQEDKISVDESGMTQFDPLLKWEVLTNITPQGPNLTQNLTTRNEYKIGSEFEF